MGIIFLYYIIVKINNFSFPSPRLLKWRLYILFDEFENISKSEKEKSELVIMLKNNTKKKSSSSVIRATHCTLGRVINFPPYIPRSNIGITL